LRARGRTPGRGLELRGDLEDEDPARPHHTEKLDDVSLGIPGFHVLKGDVGVDEVEPVGFEEPEVTGSVEVVVAPSAVAIEAFGVADHGEGDIHAVDFVEVVGESLGQAPDPAPEIQGRLMPDLQPQPLHVGQEALDLVAASCKQLLRVPLPSAFLWKRDDRPQRIGFSQRVLLFLQAPEVHPAKP